MKKSDETPVLHCVRFFCLPVAARGIGWETNLVGWIEERRKP